MAATPEPFRVHVPDEILADLQTRLELTRWPDEPADAPWSSGASLPYLREYARLHSPWPVPAGSQVSVPVGYADFPAELVRPPRSLATRIYTDIRQWTHMSKGGHFAALEQPEALSEDIRTLFRPLRARAREAAVETRPHGH